MLFGAAFAALLLALIFLTRFFPAFRPYPVIALLVGGVFLLQIDMPKINQTRLTDVVRLTALPESEGGGRQVWVEKIVVDGKDRFLTSALTGEWIVLGNKYGWKQRSAPLLETRTVEVAVPRGRQRQIIWNTGPDHGQARVEIYGESATIDLRRAEGGGPLAFDLPASDSTRLKTRFMTAVVKAYLEMLLWIAAAFAIYKTCRRHQSRLENFVGRHWPVLLIGSIAAAQALFHLSLADLKSLGYDDLVQMDLSDPGRSFPEMLKYWSGRDVSSLTFTLISYAWIQIAPYGTAWVKLPSIIFTSLGTVICGLSGKKLMGNMGGVLCAIISASWWVGVTRTVYSFRCYGFLFLISAAIMYLLIIKYTNLAGQGRWWRLKYAIALILLLHTHTCGLVLLAGLGLVEALYAYGQKRGLDFVWPYVVSGFTYLLWLATYFHMIILNPRGGVEVIFIRPLVKYAPTGLTNDNILLALALLAGFAIVAGRGLLALRELKTMNGTALVGLMSAWVIIFFFACGYLYSMQLGATASIFIDRYFTPPKPFAILLVALALNELYIWLDQRRSGPSIAATTTIFILFIGLATIVPNWFAQYKDYSASIRYSQYDVAAGWIIRQADVDEDDVLVVNTALGNRGIFYYFTQGGRLSAVNLRHLVLLKPEDLKGINKIYMTFNHELRPPLNASAPNSNIILKNFRLEEEKKDISVAVYVRKENP